MTADELIPKIRICEASFTNGYYQTENYIMGCLTRPAIGAAIPEVR